MDPAAAALESATLVLDQVLAPEAATVDDTVPVSTPVTSIVAPLPVEDLDVVATCTNSPAVTALALASAAPSVSPIASVAQTMTPVAISDTGSTGGLKAKVDRIKPQMGMNGGRWTEQEHQSFLAGLRLYGREWKKVASKIKTRTSAQIRSHAQKYFAKLARDDEMRKHSGLMPLLDGTAATHSVNTLYGYYSDGGSSPALNSGDDTDSSMSKHTSSTLDKGAVPSPASSQSSPVTSSTTASALTGLAASGSKQQEHTQQSKKRARVTATIGTMLSLQPTSKSSPSVSKHRKIVAKEASGVGLLPSQEELLEKVSPNIRQRLSSLIEAELCALQVLSCSALLQQRHGAAWETQRSPHSGGMMGLTTSLPATTSTASAATTFSGPNPLGRTMIATELIPTMPSIY